MKVESLDETGTTDLSVDITDPDSTSTIQLNRPITKVTSSDSQSAKEVTASCTNFQELDEMQSSIFLN